MAPLRGALAACVTPLRSAGPSSTRTRSSRSSTSSWRPGSTGSSPSGPRGRESCSLRSSGAAPRTSSSRPPIAGSRSRCSAGRRRPRRRSLSPSHAAEVGADAVVVIGPPYFPLDEKAQYAHFLAAATACAPLPFYVYEFATTSGYAVAPAVLERLREDASNLTGLKVSDTPWDAFSRYLLPGLDIFVGPEALIHQGLENGAIGAVSALAAAFPERVAEVVRHPTADGAASSRSFARSSSASRARRRSSDCSELRGVPVREDVRAPLRSLTPEERDELDAWHDSLSARG